LGKVKDNIEKNLWMIKELDDISDKCVEKDYRKEIDKKLNEYISLMKPLSYKRKKISEYDNLYIGTWISEKRQYHTYGGAVNKISEPLINYHDVIPDMCRRPIRDDMMKLCEILQDVKSFNYLKPYRKTYDEIRHLEYYYIDDYSYMLPELRTLKYNAMGPDAKPYNYKRVGFKWGNGWYEYKSFKISSYELLQFVDDIYDDLIGVYNRNLNELNKIVRNNKRVIEKIEEVCAPYILADRLI